MKTTKEIREEMEKAVKVYEYDEYPFNTKNHAKTVLDTLEWVLEEGEDPLADYELGI